MGALLSVVSALFGGGKWSAAIQPEEGALGPEADVPDPTTGLTLRQRTAIVRTWDLVRPDIKTHGPNFFLDLFEAEPIIQTRFKGLAGKSRAELKNNKRLVAHGTTVLMSISSMIDNLEDVGVLVELLKTTGANHKGRGVPKTDFALLNPVLVKYLRENLGTAWSPIAEEGWTQALKVINSVMISAYDQ